MQYPGNKIRNHNKQHRYTIEFVLATIHKGFYDQFFSFLEIASQRKQPIFRSTAPQNAFWETSAEIPYRWGSASDWPTQIFNQSEALPSDTSSVWNFCARSSDVILRGDQWGRHEMSSSSVCSGLEIEITLRGERISEQRKKILMIQMYRSLGTELKIWYPLLILRANSGEVWNKNL